MKLAEALMERADLNVKINQTKDMISNNLLVQEGEAPSQDLKELMSNLDAMIERLNYLVSRINLTNCKTLVGSKSLTEIIAEKDALVIQVNAYNDFVYGASQNTRRARGTEIKIKPAVNVSDLQKKADTLSAQIRKLDNTLQMTNWQVDLIEE